MPNSPISKEDFIAFIKQQHGKENFLVGSRPPESYFTVAFLQELNELFGRS